jgi:acetyltransferase-like isoleucine patch superfamily enzyme
MTAITGMTPDRRLPWDWYDGTVPANVAISDQAYLETTFSFLKFRSERPEAISLAAGVSLYLGTMFDMGPHGRVSFGEYALFNGGRIVCDAEITIGAYALISWNVVLMDTYRVPADPEARRALVRAVPQFEPRRLDGPAEARPIAIGRGVWIGFDCCVLPGVTIGEGAVVGARSVVTRDVPPFTIVAGNPARVIRRLTEEEMADGR